VAEPITATNEATLMIDPLPARCNVRQHGLAAQVHRGEVDLLHPAPGVQPGGEDRVVVGRGDTRVVQCDVDPAVGVVGGGVDPLDVLLGGHVGPYGQPADVLRRAPPRLSRSMSTHTTRAPSAASRRAVANPIPLPAPVITATRSSSLLTPTT